MEANLNSVQLLFTTIPLVGQSDHTCRSSTNCHLLAYAVLLRQTNSTVASCASGASIASIRIRPLRRCRPLRTLPVELGSVRQKVFKVELMTSFLVRMDRGRSLPGSDRRRLAGLAGTPFPRRRNNNGWWWCELSTRNSGRHARSTASGLAWRSAWGPTWWSTCIFPAAVVGRRGRWR